MGRDDHRADCVVQVAGRQMMPARRDVITRTDNNRRNCWHTACATNRAMTVFDPAMPIGFLLTGIVSFARLVRVEMAGSSPTGANITAKTPRYPSGPGEVPATIFAVMSPRVAGTSRGHDGEICCWCLMSAPMGSSLAMTGWRVNDARSIASPGARSVPRHRQGVRPATRAVRSPHSR